MKMDKKNKSNILKKINKVLNTKIEMKTIKNKLGNGIDIIKKKCKIKMQYSVIEIIILMVIGSLLGAIATTVIYNRNAKGNSYTEVSGGLQTLIDTYNNIINNYYGDVDEDTIIDGGVSGMLQAVGDPYTTYMDSSTSNTFNATLTGSYTGLGVEITKSNNEIIILAVFNDSPASAAGLKAGDVIVSIDDKKGADITSSDFSAYVRNSTNPTFTLIAKRDGVETTYTITKKLVTLKSVTSKTFKSGEKTVGYIYVSIFASNTYSQFKEQLSELEDEGIDSLIIDLRSNTGGELNTASNIISLFLNNDKVIYQTESKTETKKYYSSGTADKDYPIVILVNNSTASASEVLTSALKENMSDTVTVIGNTTYGKGTVQELLTLTTGEQYKITTKKWLTPNGNWINGTGITPDIEEKLSDTYTSNPSDETDNQLQKALQYLEER